jgi:hypothetical protein
VILRREAGEVRIVLQTDHAAVAAELARRWAEPFIPHAPVVLAAAMHDEGWRLWEAAPDRLRSFLQMEPSVHTTFYAAGVDRVEALDPYAALLCSLHASGLYNGAFGMREAPAELSPVAAAFLAAEQARRQRLPGLDDNAWRNYRLLQSWDQMALAVCGHPVKAAAGNLALGRSGGRLTVSPWPFREESFALAVPFRRLADQPWDDAESFRAALAAAPWEAEAVVLAAG